MSVHIPFALKDLHLNLAMIAKWLNFSKSRSQSRLFIGILSNWLLVTWKSSVAVHGFIPSYGNLCSWPHCIWIPAPASIHIKNNIPLFKVEPGSWTTTWRYLTKYFSSRLTVCSLISRKYRNSKVALYVKYAISFNTVIKTSLSRYNLLDWT